MMMKEETLAKKKERQRERRYDHESYIYLQQLRRLREMKREGSRERERGEMFHLVYKTHELEDEGTIQCLKAGPQN